MKINFTLLLFCLGLMTINSQNLSAQCTIQNAPASTTTAFATGFGQTFIPTCTDLLKTVSITYLPSFNASSDAIVKLMDASNAVLVTLTGQYVGPGEVTYDFTSSNITLTQGNTYTIDMHRPSTSGQMSTTISVGTYADGAFYEYDEQNNYSYFSNMFDVLFKIDMGSSLQCTAIPSSTSSPSVLNYSYSGGSFQSYGCPAVDPAYWLAGSGGSVTVTFVTPQDYPKFRVWGMNTDDVATIMVNGSPYPLEATSASYEDKVLCGIALSPGPNGVVFTSGNLAGANTNSEGNYSYQDIQLRTTNVSSIKVTGVSGAGWGFSGISVNCPLGTEQFVSNQSTSIYPNPTKDVLNINTTQPIRSIAIYDMLGNLILKQNSDSQNIDLSSFKSGIYFCKIQLDNGAVETKKIIKE